MDMFSQKKYFTILHLFDNILKFDIQLHFCNYSLIDKKKVIIR